MHFYPTLLALIPSYLPITLCLTLSTTSVWTREVPTSLLHIVVHGAYAVVIFLSLIVIILQYTRL